MGSVAGFMAGTEKSSVLSSLGRARLRSCSGKEGSNGMKRWLRRIGVMGFLFFLLKGLVWLAVFYGLIDLAKG